MGHTNTGICDWHVVGTELFPSKVLDQLKYFVLLCFLNTTPKKKPFRQDLHTRSPSFDLSSLRLVKAKHCVLFLFYSIVLFLWPTFLTHAIKQSGKTVTPIKFVWLIPLCWWKQQWCQRVAQDVLGAKTATMFVFLSASLLLLLSFKSSFFLRNYDTAFCRWISHDRPRVPRLHTAILWCILVPASNSTAADILM